MVEENNDKKMELREAVNLVANFLKDQNLHKTLSTLIEETKMVDFEKQEDSK